MALHTAFACADALVNLYQLPADLLIVSAPSQPIPGDDLTADIDPLIS
jgi:hypothetical protein